MPTVLFLQRRLLAVYLFSLETAQDPDRPVFQKAYDTLSGKKVEKPKSTLAEKVPNYKPPLRSTV